MRRGHVMRPPRMTTRRWMVAVAVAGSALAGCRMPETLPFVVALLFPTAFLTLVLADAALIASGDDDPSVEARDTTARREGSSGGDAERGGRLNHEGHEGHEAGK